MTRVTEDERFSIEDLEFHRVQKAYPEEFEVFKEGDQVASIRAGNGWIIVDCPTFGSKHVLQDVFSDHGDGGFKDVDQRKYWMEAAADVIQLWMMEGE